MFKIHYLDRMRGASKNDPKKTGGLKLIAGLGNPGDKYKNTFHNVGFMFIDHLMSGNPRRIKKYRDFEFLKTDRFVAIKSLGFMNQSGIPIKRALKYFGVEAKDLTVIHDDSDIELGQYKISSGRGSAGHKGVESIFKELKTEQFDRLRIGVRKHYGGHPRPQAGDFVLNRMNEEDGGTLEKVFLEIEALYFKT